jgi:hypothetical protein
VTRFDYKLYEKMYSRSNAREICGKGRVGLI